MDTLTNTLLLLVLLSGVVWLLLSIASIHKMLTIRRHLAVVRQKPEQAPLFSDQPLPVFSLQEKHPPLVITKRLSRGAHIILLAVWFSIAVLFILTISFPTGLPSSGPLIPLAKVLGFWSMYWVIVQGIVTLRFYQRIEASESGLLVQRGVLRRRISWSQARLFAIDYPNSRGMTWTHYELSGTAQVVRWQWDNSRESRPQFTFIPPPPEYQQELERLLSYVHEKTGLPLRDLRSCRR